MNPKDSLFFTRSKKVAESFLQTTVIVDDQAYYESDEPAKEIITPGSIDLIPPGRAAPSAKAKKVTEGSNIQKVLITDQETGSHRLDAQKVIESFAERQIVCSVIKPVGKSDWFRTVEKLAYHADILILDWDIKDDRGQKALELLQKILKSANQIPAQLRLVVIYTGSPRIAEISEEIKQCLEKKLKIDPKQIEEQDNGFAFKFGSTRIVIFSKPDTKNLPEEYSSRTVGFEQLAERVIAEFTVMTAGLVSNAAVKSLALVRKNTHKIINKFSPYLDTPYLTHRILQDIPDDAEVLLTELVAEEIRAILDEERVGNEADLESIKDWLLMHHGAEATFSLDETISFTLNDVVELMKIGLNKCPKISNTKKGKLHRLPVTEMLKPSTVDDEFLDERFGLITTVRSHYANKKPKLTFGSILQKQRDNSYWVCLQPRCDSVRIESERAFPVLPLEVSSENNKFRLILEDETIYVRLGLKDKPYNLVLLNFLSYPDYNGSIVAKSQGGNFYFTTTNHVKYKWVGELKPEQAQRIANEFATNLSRVGLDESEWLRLWATKG